MFRYIVQFKYTEFFECIIIGVYFFFFGTKELSDMLGCKKRLDFYDANKNI